MRREAAKDTLTSADTLKDAFTSGAREGMHVMERGAKGMTHGAKDAMGRVRACLRGVWDPCYNRGEDPPCSVFSLRGVAAPDAPRWSRSACPSEPARSREWFSAAWICQSHCAR